MASWHIKEIAELNPIKITLIVGMCGFDGISKSVHEGFKNIASRRNGLEQTDFSCQYVVKGMPVHSKLYLWERGGVPFKAYMGSANYTQPAFFSSGRELIQECDPLQASTYFDVVDRNAVYCTHAEIEDMVLIKPTHPILENEEAPLLSVRGAGVESVTLSLLTAQDDVGFGSGINWGHRKTGPPRKNTNEMYISLPAGIKNKHPEFFPTIGNPTGKGNPNFSVLTDDGKHFILRVQQQGNKGITTPLSNAQIGEYFRYRINVGNGAFVTKQDLENYGRTDVTFYKLDDEQYFMDFSV